MIKRKSPRRTPRALILFMGGLFFVNRVDDKPVITILKTYRQCQLLNMTPLGQLHIYDRGPTVLMALISNQVLMVFSH